jgi:hypothetical protein
MASGLSYHLTEKQARYAAAPVIDVYGNVVNIDCPRQQPEKNVAGNLSIYFDKY